MNKAPLSLDLRPVAVPRRSLGIWVGCITVAVATAVLFCEAHFTAAPIEQTVMTAAVVILSCFIMYTSLFDAGHEKAEDTDEYRTVTDAYYAARDAARPAMSALEDFCRAWSVHELTEARMHLLEGAGLSDADFLAYRDQTLSHDAWRALTRMKRRALRRAGRLKPVHLHAAMLLSGGKSVRQTPHLSTRPLRLRRTAVALIPTVLGSLVTVAVTLESMEMTPAAIISGVLRIFTIVWCGVRGYTAGMRAAQEDDATVLETKTALLTAFLSDTQQVEPPTAGDC